MSDTPMARVLDTIEWTGLDEPEQLHPGDVYATHEGVLKLPGFPPMRVYQLNTGERVFNGDDFAAALGLQPDDVL